MYPESNEANMKQQQADKAYYADSCETTQVQAVGVGCAGPALGKSANPYSLQDEASKRAHHHYEQAGKAQAAALFFAQNPAFEEFIRLVRSRSIQF